MREIINRILTEKFDHNQGVISFSTKKEELVLQKGEVREGSFIMTVSNTTTPMEGYVSATGSGMQCIVNEFKGMEVTISYRFDTKNMDEGEVLKGEFIVVSNKGEYYLPYVVTVQHSLIQSSMGPIKNLFHFTNLAKSSWKEAAELFYAPQFKQIFSETEQEYYAQYLLLSHNSMNEQNVEEFLNVVNKKQRIEYIVENEEIRIDNPKGYHEEKINIVKNGWGYVYAQIESDVDFLICEKKEIKAEQFTGNHLNMNVYVDSSKLHAGNNEGNLIFKTVYEEIPIHFKVRVTNEKNSRMHENREKKRIRTQVMTYYLAFRTRKISKETWVSESMPLIEKWNAYDEKDVESRLIQALLLMAEDRYNEARWILEHANRILEQSNPLPEIYCYYLYLTTLYNREESYVDEITEEINEIYKRQPDNWKIAWTLLFLRTELQGDKDLVKKWLFMQEQYEFGCNSPVWYSEAALLLLTESGLITVLDDFTISVLYFMAKNGLITEKISQQINAVMAKSKNHSEKIFWILKVMYAKYGNRETLETICTYLIKTGKTSEEYLKWYRLGIEKELRITKLYEYFMWSINLKKQVELPKMLLMYFTYQADLEYDRMAYLYAYVIRNRERFPELAEAYRSKIEIFLVDQIQNGRINKDLAFLYENELSLAMLDQSSALKLIPLIFTNLLEIERNDIKRVILLNKLTTGEFDFEVEDDQCLIPIYSREYKIALEDSHGNRFMDDDSLELQKLILPGKMVKLLENFELNHFGYDLYLCENYQNNGPMQGKWVKRFERLAESNRITLLYRQEIRSKLMQYFYEHDLLIELDAFLENLSAKDMLPSERSEAIQYMILRGMNEKAYKWVHQYGIQGIDVKVLMRLTSRLISSGQLQEDALLNDLTYYIFQRGKSDEFTLRYLVKYYRGLTRQLRDIFRAAEGFEIDTRLITERMLLQMMYTGSFVGEKMQVLRSYIDADGDAEIIEAFLSFCAFDYFVKEKLEDEFVFEELLRIYHKTKKLNVVARLAVLKYFSEHPAKQGNAEANDLDDMLRELLQLQYYFPFFQTYAKRVPQVKYMADYTTLEYRTDPENKVIIHYMLVNDENGAKEFRKEEMENTYGGIFQKHIALFYSETIQYYITEEMDRKEQLTKSDVVCKSDIAGGNSEGVFHLVNDIVIAQNMQDYDTVDELTEEYYLTKYRTTELFKKM